jgi:hypothetical protein
MRAILRIKGKIDELNLSKNKLIAAWNYFCLLTMNVCHYTDDILVSAKIARMIMPVGIGFFLLSWIPVIARKVRFK